MKAAFVVFDRVTYLHFIGFYDPVTRLKTIAEKLAGASARGRIATQMDYPYR